MHGTANSKHTAAIHLTCLRRMKVDSTSPGSTTPTSASRLPHSGQVTTNRLSNRLAWPFGNTPPAAPGEVHAIRHFGLAEHHDHHQIDQPQNGRPH